MVSGFVARVESNSSLELSLGAIPVPIVVQFGKSERSMRFGEAVIDAQGLMRGLFGTRHGLAGRQTAVSVRAEQQIAVGQAHISQCVPRVAADRSCEIVDCRFDALRSPLIPEEATLQVELIGLIV